VLNCNPILINVLDTETVDIDVEWFVNDRMVEEETFKLQEKTVGTLGQTKWTVGQTVRVIENHNYTVITHLLTVLSQTINTKTI
jgi:hypothetical protein